jgi:hypothetical protein
VGKDIIRAAALTATISQVEKFRIMVIVVGNPRSAGPATRGDLLAIAIHESLGVYLRIAGEPNEVCG